MTIHIGNAPCSWGTLEFKGIGSAGYGYAQMLAELAETGYNGSELGDWGIMPTDPALLAAALRKHHLAMTGAFVPVDLKDSLAHSAGEEQAVTIAQLIANAADRLESATRPFLVLADTNGSDPVRTKHAGRISAAMGLSSDEWAIFASGANRIALAVKQKSGLRTVFHHHCAGFVETPTEIDQFLTLTDPDLVGLVFDTGHYAFGSGDCMSVRSALDVYANRIWYVHYKDCSPAVIEQAQKHEWNYFEAVAQGVFCELGQGGVNFPAVTDWLRSQEYQGFITVEQDVLPGMGSPKTSAARNRAYLRSIGL